MYLDQKPLCSRKVQGHRYSPRALKNRSGCRESRPGTAMALIFQSSTVCTEKGKEEGYLFFEEFASQANSKFSIKFDGLAFRLIHCPARFSSRNSSQVVGVVFGRPSYLLVCNIPDRNQYKATGLIQRTGFKGTTLRVVSSIKRYRRSAQWGARGAVTWVGVL